jgi:protease IV
MIRRAAPLAVAVFFLALATLPGTAGAQSWVKPTSGVLLPSPSLTEVNDATAIAVNPANLGFLDAWSFTYAGAFLKDDPPFLHQVGEGHGLFLAVPLGPLGFGIATEFMTPPSSTLDWQGLDDRTRLSLSMAVNFNRAVGIGLAYRHFFSSNPVYGLDGLDLVDIGLSVRPVNHLALSVFVADLNTPTVRTSPTGAGFDGLRTRTPLRVDVGLTVRPFGNDRMGLGGELAYLHSADSYQRTDAAGLLTLMVVDGLTLRGRFGVEGLSGDQPDPTYFVDASLMIDFENFGIGMGIYSQVGPKGMRDPVEAVAWSVRFSGDAAPALWVPSRVPVITLTEQPDTYGFTGLVALFERMQRDRGVNVVLLRPDPDTLSLAQAEEVRRRIIALQADGKKVACYMTDATGPVYLACAAADRVWLNPAGGVRLSGLSTSAIFVKNLLEKIGVKADILRVGEYKSAPESLTRTGPSEASNEAMNAFLDSVYDRLLTDLAADRGFGNADVTRSIVEQGPYVAREALGAKLVDKLVTGDALEDELRELVDGPLLIDDKYGDVELRHRRYLDAPAVAVVHIRGDIVDGDNVDVPFLDIHMTGARTLTKVLRKLREDSRVAAVVLRIDSPGGSALGSDLVWREVMRLRETKPVVASLGAVAASGAYYIASAAHEIYSEPTTLTGSIGIFYGKADLSGLLSKVGINVTTYKRGAHADMESWVREYTPEERQRLSGQIREYYQMFLDRVVEGRGRGFTREVANKLGRGRIWSGEDARYNLLVDEIGGYAEALDRARELGGVHPDTMVFEYPEPETGLLKIAVRMLGMERSEPSIVDALLMNGTLKKTLGAAFPFSLMDPGAPQARLPYAFMEP